MTMKKQGIKLNSFVQRGLIRNDKLLYSFSCAQIPSPNLFRASSFNYVDNLEPQFSWWHMAGVNHMFKD